MNIVEFKEKVYNRIITKYMQDVKKTKLVWSDCLFFLKPFISFSLVLILSLYVFENSENSESIVMFLAMLSMAVSSFIMFMKT